MGRSSDTRQLTRLTAAKLVAQGRAPHSITVDQIYAEIQQGSRTTINDELKRWREEQDKQQALSAALPEPVAQAMLQAWAVAVEHGEQVFERRQAEIEAELSQMGAQVEAARAAQENALNEAASLKTATERAHAEMEVLRVERRHEQETTQTALGRAASAEERLESLRATSQQQLEALRAQHERQLSEQKQQFMALEAKYREELALATERLEGVQQHVMRQVTEARDAQRKAEEQLTKSQERLERQAGDLESLRGERIALTTQLHRATQDAATMQEQTTRLQREKEEHAVKLASVSARLEGAAEVIAELKQQLLESKVAALSADDKSAEQPNAAGT